MEQSHEEIEAAGLRIVAVGLGEPKHAQRFCGKLAPSLVCYVDQDETAYKTYGLQQGGILALAGPATFIVAARAAASGHVQGEATGDTRMLPGTFIIDGAGIVQFAYYSRHPGDHPKIKKLVEVLAEQFDEEE